jgi:hypothetical protein
MRIKFLFYILLFFSLGSYAQFIDDEEPEYKKTKNDSSWTKKLFYGGDLGLMFGDFTYVNISPTVAYPINDYYSLGIGIIYNYISDKRYIGYEYSTTIFGSKFFAQSVLFDVLLLYAEENIISLEKKYFDVIHQFPEKGRFLTQIPQIGAGYYQKSEGGGGMYFMVLLNLNYSINSPYAPYEYRIGFNF